MITSSPVKDEVKPTDQFHDEEVWCSEEHVQNWINNINEDEINGDRSSSKSSMDGDTYLVIPNHDLDDEMEIGADARQFNLHNVSMKSPRISPLLPLTPLEIPEPVSPHCSATSRDNRSDVSNSLREANIKILEACKAAQATNSQINVNGECENAVLQKENSGSLMSFGSSFDNPSSLAAVLQPDPEEILLNLGFGGGHEVSLLDTIPPRFFQEASTVCGIDVESFHKSLMENEDVNSVCSNYMSLPHRFSIPSNNSHSSDSLNSLNAENRRILYKSCHRDIPSIHLSFDADCPPSPTTGSIDMNRNRLATLTELSEPGSRGSSFEEELSNEVAAAFSNALRTELKSISSQENSENSLNVSDEHKKALLQEKRPVCTQISDMYSNLVIPSVVKRKDSNKSLCSNITVVPKEEPATTTGESLSYNAAVFKPIIDDDMDMSPTPNISCIAFEVPDVSEEKSAISKRMMYREDRTTFSTKCQEDDLLVDDIENEAHCVDEVLLDHSGTVKTQDNSRQSTAQYTIKVDPTALDIACETFNSPVNSDSVDDGQTLPIDVEIPCEEIHCQNAEENISLVAIAKEEFRTVCESNTSTTGESIDDINVLQMELDNKDILNHNNSDGKESITDQLNVMDGSEEGSVMTSNENEKVASEEELTSKNTSDNNVFSVEIRRSITDDKTAKSNDALPNSINEADNDYSNTLKLIEDIKTILSKPMNGRENSYITVDDNCSENPADELQIINEIKDILSKTFHNSANIDMNSGVDECTPVVEDEVIVEQLESQYSSYPTEVIDIKSNDDATTCDSSHGSDLVITKPICEKGETTTSDNIHGTSYEISAPMGLDFDKRKLEVNNLSKEDSIETNVGGNTNDKICELSTLDKTDSDKDNSACECSENSCVSGGEDKNNLQNSRTMNEREGIGDNNEEFICSCSDVNKLNTDTLNHSKSDHENTLINSCVDDITEKQITIDGVVRTVDFIQELGETRDVQYITPTENILNTSLKNDVMINETVSDIVDSECLSDSEKLARFNGSFIEFCNKLNNDFQKENNQVPSVEINENICEKPASLNSKQEVQLASDHDVPIENISTADMDNKKSTKSYLSAAFQSIAMALGKYQDSKPSKCADGVLSSENDMNEEEEKSKEEQKEKKPKRKLFNIFNHRTATLETSNAFPLLAANLMEGRIKTDTPENEGDDISASSQIHIDYNTVNTISPTPVRKYQNQHATITPQTSIDNIPNNIPDSLHGYIPDSPLSSDDDQPCSSTRNRRKRFNSKHLSKGVSMESSGFDEDPTKHRCTLPSSNFYCSNCNDPSYVHTKPPRNNEEVRFTKELDKLMNDTKSHFEQNFQKCDCGRTNYYGFISHSHFEYVIKQLTRVRTEINTHFDLQAKRESELKLLLNNQVNEMKQIMTTEYMGWIMREMDFLKAKLKEKDEEIQKLRGECPQL